MLFRDHEQLVHEKDQIWLLQTKKEEMPNHRPRLVDSLVEKKKKTEKYKALIGKYES